MKESWMKTLNVCFLSELSHEADQLMLMRCLREQLKSSAEAAIILEQSRAIQVRHKRNVSIFKYSIFYQKNATIWGSIIEGEGDFVATFGVV